MRINTNKETDSFDHFVDDRTNYNIKYNIEVTHYDGMGEEPDSYEYEITPEEVKKYVDDELIECYVLDEEFEELDSEIGLQQLIHNHWKG